jgi:PHD/YefM family antitoxin component YafN of YafNO toxin-antitoxin module
MSLPIRSISEAEQALCSGLITPTIFVEEDDTRHQVLVFDHRPVGYSGFMDCVTHSLALTNHGLFEVGCYPAVSLSSQSRYWQWFLHRRLATSEELSTLFENEELPSGCICQAKRGQLDEGRIFFYNPSKVYKDAEPLKEMGMERKIGATELRQRLTDVLQAVREERATYIVETFERSQAALVNLDEYRQFLNYREAREAFFEWLETTAAQNAAQNLELSDDEVMTIIQQARQEAEN